METLDHTNYFVWLHFSNHLMLKENHLNNACCFCRRWESNLGRPRSKRVRYPLRHCLSATNQELKSSGLLVAKKFPEDVFCSKWEPSSAKNWKRQLHQIRAEAVQLEWQKCSYPQNLFSAGTHFAKLPRLVKACRHALLDMPVTILNQKLITTLPGKYLNKRQITKLLVLLA